MKSLSVILLSTFALLTSCFARQPEISPRVPRSPEGLKITTHVVKSAEKLPVILKPGAYSDKQIKDLFIALSKLPNLEISALPTILTKSTNKGDFDEAVASDAVVLAIGKIKFTGMQIAIKNQSLIFNGVYQGDKPNVTIKFNEPIALNESIIKIKGNTAVIIGLKKP